jgi:hypothetical protein
MWFSITIGAHHCQWDRRFSGSLTTVLPSGDTDSRSRPFHLRDRGVLATDAGTARSAILRFCVPCAPIVLQAVIRETVTAGAQNASAPFLRCVSELLRTRFWPGRARGNGASDGPNCLVRSDLDDGASPSLGGDCPMCTPGPAPSFAAPKRTFMSPRVWPRSSSASSA